MSEQHAALNRNTKSCFTFVFILIFSTLSSINLAPDVEASSGGNLAILQSVKPVEDSWVPSYESVLFTATIENLYQVSSQPGRILKWYVCEGENPSNVCISTSIDDGSISVNSILPGASGDFTSSDYFNPLGYEGLMTVVYQFDQFDLNPSNDIYTFTINSTSEFSDIEINTNIDIIQQIPNLAVHNGEFILNSNQLYPINLPGFANICGTCNINATIGWQLTSNKQIISQSYLNTSSFPKLGFSRPFNVPLPDFSHNETGNFNLIYGLFESNGSPHDDMDFSNDLFNVSILINDDVDLMLSNLYPSHNPSSDDYYFGDNMITSQLENNGNKTIHNITITMQIINSFGEIVNTDACLNVIILPSQQITCTFDISTSGLGLKIYISIPTTLPEGPDIDINNNNITEITDIIIPSLSGYIVNNDPKEWYTDQDLISLTGNSNLYAPGPINYSWWYSGIINLGYEQTLNLNASEIGLGEHMIRFTVRDVFGNTENIYYSINIYYFVEIDQSPEYIASSVTVQQAVIESETMLPLDGESYGVGNGKSPLLLLSFDLKDSNSNQSPFTGTNWMDIEINSSSIIPSTISFDSLEIRELDSLNDTIWDFFDQSNVDFRTENGNISVRIFESTTILLIGEMETPNVDAQNFSGSLIAGGKIRLDWNPVGELNNDYISGWNIYQKLVVPSGGTVFPSPNQVFNQLIWEDLTQDSLRTFLPITDEYWNDPLELLNDLCTSYAIVPVDRQGTIHFELANVTTDENGDGAFLCGDNTPPSSSVIQFSHSWEFTNSSDCFKLENDWSMCYQVDLSWIWPEHEADGNVTWNLYRIDQNPQNINLALIQPILKNVEAVANETGNYTANGWEQNGIRPERTYFYILTPIDWIGNEENIVSYPSENIERVQIKDDWWPYYQHLIPEAPEPEELPLGSEWLGNFSESMDQQEFKLAGTVLLVVICISMIMLPLIIKKRKRLKRIINARSRQLRADSMADEFDDFFD